MKPSISSSVLYGARPARIQPPLVRDTQLPSERRGVEVPVCDEESLLGHVLAELSRRTSFHPERDGQGGRTSSGVVYRLIPGISRSAARNLSARSASYSSMARIGRVYTSRPASRRPEVLGDATVHLEA